MKRPLRQDARTILTAALVAADPTAALEKALRARTDLDRYARIFVVGAGKAGSTMGRAVEQILGDRISAGCVNVRDPDSSKLRYIELRQCGHPVPDERGFNGARRIAELCSQAGENDLVVCLLSGGASALMPYPASPVTLADKRETTQLLLASGADIHEMNVVRKHLSAIKGGHLARLAAPAHVLCLILSDVVGDDLDSIGSGPTAPDASTFQDALCVLDKYQLRARVPRRVLDRLKNGGGETPKPGDVLFENVENIIIGNNQKSLEAAAREARVLGYHPLILSSFIEGETRDVGRMHAAIARQIRAHGQPIQSPACVISGGETTVTIRGDGKGGRNQEFVLAAAIDIAGLEDTLILSAGTDGSDGPTDAAGAMANGATLARSSRNAAEALANNDAYPYFEDLGDLIVTRATGTNVMRSSPDSRQLIPKKSPRPPALFCCARATPDSPWLAAQRLFSSFLPTRAIALASSTGAFHAAGAQSIASDTTLGTPSATPSAVDHVETFGVTRLQQQMHMPHRPPELRPGLPPVLDQLHVRQPIHHLPHCFDHAARSFIAPRRNPELQTGAHPVRHLERRARRRHQIFKHPRGAKCSYSQRPARIAFTLPRLPVQVVHIRQIRARNSVDFASPLRETFAVRRHSEIPGGSP